jgi:hypothetical protein
MRRKVKVLNVSMNKLVSDIVNLLHRRFVIGGGSELMGPGFLNGLQNAILRYGRLEICATEQA